MGSVVPGVALADKMLGFECAAGRVGLIKGL